MVFEWGRMQNTPEGRLGRSELRRRGDTLTMEELAAGYARQAEEVLSGPDAITARDEISRFAKKINETQGPEQQDELGRLANALGRRRKSILDDIPDDAHERAAFALALLRKHEHTLQ